MLKFPNFVNIGFMVQWWIKIAQVTSGMGKVLDRIIDGQEGFNFLTQDGDFILGLAGSFSGICQIGESAEGYICQAHGSNCSREGVHDIVEMERTRSLGIILGRATRGTWMLRNAESCLYLGAVEDMAIPTWLVCNTVLITPDVVVSDLDNI